MAMAKGNKVKNEFRSHVGKRLLYRLSGIARIFLTGTDRESEGRKSPRRIQGQSPGGGLGAKPPEARDNSQKIVLKIA